MLKSKKKIFSIFLFSFIFMVIFSIIPFSRAGTVDNPIVDVDILSVQLGSFQDGTTGDGSGKLKSASGGYDLISFINQGEYSRDLTNNKIVFKARVKLGFETNVWTATTFHDHYPNINLNKETSVPFFTIHYWKHISDWAKWMGAYQVSKSTYFSRYREIDFGSTFRRHDYDGNLPITVSIDSGLKFSGEITLGGSTFTVPELASDIINVKISDTRSGEVGSYEDYYTNQGHSEGKATVTVLDPSISSLTKKVVDWIDSQNIGWQKSEETASPTVQQSIRDEGCKGTTFSDSTSRSSMTFNLPVHIQPEITKTRELIEFNKGFLKYFVCDGGIDKAIVDGFTMQRDVSVHVKNQFVHYEFEIETDLFMTLQFEGRISQSFLSDPNLHISDMLWDNAMLGSHAVNIGLVKEQDLLGTLLLILAIGIIIVVGYLAYKYYKKKNRSNIIIIKR